eukprot:230428-Prorocentrum_lima.AAC.1
MTPALQHGGKGKGGLPRLAASSHCLKTARLLLRRWRPWARRARACGALGATKSPRLGGS